MVIYKDVEKTKTKHLPLGRFDCLETDRIIRGITNDVKEAFKGKELSVSFEEEDYAEFDKEGVGEPKKIAKKATVTSKDGLFNIYVWTEKKWSSDKNYQKIHASMEFKGQTYKELDDYKTLRKIMEGF